MDLGGKLVRKADIGPVDGNIHHGVACRQNMLPHSCCRFANLTFRAETKDVFPIPGLSQGATSYEVTTSLSQTPQKLSLVQLTILQVFPIFHIFVGVCLYSMGRKKGPWCTKGWIIFFDFFLLLCSMARFSFCFLVVLALVCNNLSAHGHFQKPQLSVTTFTTAVHYYIFISCF